MSDSVHVAGPGTIDFAFLIYRFGGEPGAREAFEHLVADVVGIIHPDVQEVQANPGDWGIDAFVGELTAASEAWVWQAKYFIHEFGKAQQADVRSSYASALRAADTHGYKLKSWTLCVPIELDGPNLRWWHSWAKRKEKADGVVIDLWTAGTLRRRLMDDEAQNVRNYHFSPIFPTKTTTRTPSSQGRWPRLGYRRHLLPAKHSSTRRFLLAKSMTRAFKLNSTRSVDGAFGCTPPGRRYITMRAKCPRSASPLGCFDR